MRLKELREERGLNQKDVAAFINKTVQSYSYYERGERNPDTGTLKKLAEYFGVTIDYLLGESDIKKECKKKGVKIPVLGRVQAGAPIEAIEEIIGYEEIDEDLAKTGEFFALQVKGNSMETAFYEGDIIIIKKQPDLESGQIGVALVNGQDATIKQIIKHESGISLVAQNPAYPPRIFTFEDIEKLPVVILGRAIELRRNL